MLACFAASGPMVATFHTATARSRGAAGLRHRAAAGAGEGHRPHRRLARPRGGWSSSTSAATRSSSRTASTSPASQGAKPLPGPAGRADRRLPRPHRRAAQGPGRAARGAARAGPRWCRTSGCSSPGPATPTTCARRCPPSLRDRVELLGLVSEQDKPRVFASGDVYCAPNTHGESFGIVLVEAMAAGTPVVASDLEAFRRVLEDGAAGVLVPVRDAGALAAALGRAAARPRAPGAAGRRGPPGRPGVRLVDRHPPGRRGVRDRRRRGGRAGRRRRRPRGGAAAGATRSTTTPAGWSRRCAAGCPSCPRRGGA